jgi:exodeoxyribonuclease V alpha subunit
VTRLPQAEAPVPFTDRRDPRVAAQASGLLRQANLAGVLTAADVHVAERLGRLGGEGDDRVLLAVGLAVRAVRGGSVALDLADLGNLGLPEGLGGADGPPELPWPQAAGWAQAVKASPLHGAGAIRVDSGLLYLDRYWHEETQVVADLRTRATARPPEVEERQLRAALDEHFPDPAHTDQRLAAETAARHWTSVVTGGPGTGKTTTVARLLGVLLAVHGPGLRIGLAAPTGKAAARMAQAVREATWQDGFPGRDGAPGDPADERAQIIRGLTAATLHRLLGSRPDNRTRFRHHRGNRLGYDVVVIDETSMVSVTMMARLLEAVRPEARLVLVGDADQLASVEAGAVLKDLVEGLAGGPGSGQVSRLSGNRRYGAEIGALADATRRGDPEGVLAELRSGREQVRWLDAGELPGLLRERAVALHAAAASGQRAAALRLLDQHRLLCAHREGPFGVTRWNTTVERLLRSGTRRDWLPEWYAGRPLVVNGNDYALGLFNGDTGVVCAEPTTPGGGLVAVVADGEAPEGRAVATTRLSDVSTAHAMTVHRSQGSQFEEVTVVLPGPDSHLLTRELLYTAVTRARRVVRLVGSEDAVRAAVTRRAQRATGLARRLGDLT